MPVLSRAITISFPTCSFYKRNDSFIEDRRTIEFVNTRLKIWGERGS
jgi:hypothetical protein